MRRRQIAALAGLVLAGLLPVGAAADDDKDESGKGRGNEKDDDTRRAPAPASPTQRPPVTAPPASSLTTPQGTERMVSDQVQLVGPTGTGAGPVRLDVAGARPNSTYEVQYVPASNPTIGVILGRVQTDAAGRFAGTAPEPMPAIAEPGRRGVFAFRRVG